IVSRDGNKIVCRKQFTGDEWFFAGHYPDDPIVPGVILCEAAMQAGAVLLAGQDNAGRNGDEAAQPADSSSQMPVVTRMNDVRFKQIVRRGDAIEIEVVLRERLGEAYFFDAKISSSGKMAVRLEFACMLVAKSEATP